MGIPEGKAEGFGCLWTRWIDDGEAQYKKLLESLHGQRSDIGEQESQGAKLKQQSRESTPKNGDIRRFFLLNLSSIIY